MAGPAALPRCETRRQADILGAACTEGGPVELPPCMRHRVYRPVFGFHIAGARQAQPSRVFAPHRGAFDGSPAGSPFLRPVLRITTLHPNPTQAAVFPTYLPLRARASLDLPIFLP